MKNQFIITTFFLSTVLSFGQKFSVEKLITIAGNNKDFCIASPSVQECTHDSYICWVNQLDSVYAIYLRQFFPENGELLTVHSAMTPQLNPTIAYDPTDEVLRIAWQSQINNHWRLLIREYKNQEFGNTIISSDTLSNSIAPSIGSNGLAWIQDGALVYENENSEITLIDSLLCSNPQLFPYEYLGDPVIVYEKGDIHSKQIFFAQYIGQHREHLPHWEVKKISNESHCINPKFGTLQGISYQSLEDGIWKIVYNILDIHCIII